MRRPSPGSHACKYHFDGRDPSRQNELVESRGDPVAQRGNAVRLRRHCTLPCRRHGARGSERETATADQEKLRRPARQRFIENSFRESADKSLLGTEDDPRTSSVRRSRGWCLIAEPHRRCYRSCDHLGIGTKPGQQQATLLCMGCRDATHGADHRIELLHAVDASADRGEVVSHWRSAVPLAR